MPGPAAAGAAGPGRDRLPPYPCFLLSLAWPGLGQLLGGRTARGLTLMLASATLLLLFLTGTVQMPLDPAAGAAGLAASLAGLLLWGFAPYDAWFLVRERLNGMLPSLPRTPRVAALADLFWGGAGRIYLHRGAPGPWFSAYLPALLTLLPVAALLLTADMAWLAGLLLWNGALAFFSHQQGVARYHGSNEYSLRLRRFLDAPVDSPMAPSPALPLATMVAAVIAVMGGVLAVRTVQDMSLPSPPQAPTGTLTDGRYSDAAHGVELQPPGAGWQLVPRVPPTLLTARLPDAGRSFSLAVALTPLFREADVIPVGALTRFATRQEAELAGLLPGFAPLSREPREVAGRPGLRLLFSSGAPGSEMITVQQFILDQDRILVMTLSGPAAAGAEPVVRDLERWAAGLQVEEIDS